MSGNDRMMKTLDGADGAIETPGSARTVDGGQPILDVDHLDVTFSTDAGDVHAVKDVSLAVSPGEVLAIVGESGSGKTVTARSILGLLPETAQRSGAVVLSGSDVLAVSAEELREMRGSDVAMVFQEPSTALNPVFTVGWQIAEGLRAHHRKASRAELKAKVVAAMEQVGIPDAEHRFDYYPHQFSGGQKQRIVIAMALALGAKLIVADEPTTALDVTVQAEILDLLRELRDETGTAIVLITHNMGVVADLADRVAVMYRGDLIEVSPVKTLFSDPKEQYTRDLLAAVPKLGSTVVGSRKAAAADRDAGDGRDAADDRDAVVDREPGPAAEEGSFGTTASARKRERTAASAGDSVVVANGLDIVYPGGLGRPDFHAVKSVSFEIRAGEVYGLVGESGSGKTTIGRAIAGLTRASGGSLSVLGHEMVGFRERSFRSIRKRIGFVFQDPAASFNPHLTIGECIAEPFAIHRPELSVRDRGARVLELLDSVQLPADYAGRYPHELSGGQRQRASLARGLALDPELLIADEPTSALDVSVQAKVLELFVELQNRFDFAALFISHDLAVVDMLSDRIGVLYHGRLLEEGTGEQVLGSPSNDYTKRLIASLPVPDPVEQAQRREAARQLRAAAGA
ncbi:dipeptide ABC transporter ATP-binding protein [Brevibacterium casei]|uniref:dipeptide ABC transporter ATP-binding protein n=1 Tax=Brevibacterium casei TaxID=33889 RepID=UPI000928DB53|nr:ABC transporter ATP-binding protein [Brevibacterium casei]MBE4694388.1 ABC transporter ATP-binding protein [Brevibacterium casei]MBY3577510.1 ABC transporter ATP-binding protein [Brevibacterium casei]MCT1447512.1 ABC transporter ATP-binding protein [Brevibacterium casei]SIG83810.1 putative oligopeptide ABC transporter, ATP-binding protein [Mycobacteroides abscessus subsp. abscessus]